LRSTLRMPRKIMPILVNSSFHSLFSQMSEEKVKVCEFSIEEIYQKYVRKL
jgi:hypothetical protein